MPSRSETRAINDFLTQTLSEYIPTLHDNIFDDVPLLSFLNGKLRGAVQGNSAKKMLSGGDRILEPLLYGRNSTIDSYAGAEVLDTTLQDGVTNATFPWKQYSGSVGITGLHRRGNMGKHQLINMLQSKTTQAELTFQERLNQDSYQDGTGNNSKNVDGLAKQVSATLTTGGLNPSTHAWWKAEVDSSSPAFDTDGRKKMTTMFNTLTIGRVSPDLMLTTQDIYEFYETSLIDQKRFQSDKVADAGFQNLTFKGRPIVFDRDCPSGLMYFLNSKYIKWVVHSDADFAPTDFVRPENQDASVSLILLQANITISNRRRLGVISGITES